MHRCLMRHSYAVDLRSMLVERRAREVFASSTEFCRQVIDAYIAHHLHRAPFLPTTAAFGVSSNPHTCTTWNETRRAAGGGGPNPNSRRASRGERLSPDCPPQPETTARSTSTTAAKGGGRSADVLTVSVWCCPVVPMPRRSAARLKIRVSAVRFCPWPLAAQRVGSACSPVDLEGRE